LSAELDANHVDFEVRWKAQWTAAETDLENDPAFKKAYRRLVAMQAWRSELLDGRLPQSALQFAVEGQNDLLVAYLQARTGQWRSALQSQRAALENYLNCLFFMDHPIEAELWEETRYTTQFSELHAYFLRHPKIFEKEARFCGLDIIKSEYSTLSKAVHGSAKAFRMSSDAGPKFFSSDKAFLGKWDHRNRQVIRGITLLMIALFRDDLAKTRKRNLRKSLCLALRTKDREWIKKELKVTIPF